MAINPDVPRSSGSNPDSEQSVLGLVRQLAHEVPALISEELALAKAEIKTSIDTAKAATAAVAGGVVFMLAGLVILLMAAVYGLALYVAPWLAALIVGGGAMIAGFVMVQSGKKQLEPSQLAPERTMHALNKDKDAIQRKVS
ncbi:phage holin family protein [Pseudomonas sp. efr-133-TYG-103a]|uniref:phage holin family protein n=1 Tax=Pseudomonas sp. efr-133-TYG-103a TaxID=3040308 RepID=UPI0025526279|nr:phage holin family protein [Pseudomonas sp. efr-133-TYG-103a]